MNIVLARIDDRLIHGQVMTAWVQYTGGNEIVIADDKVANDPFLSNLVKLIESIQENMAYEGAEVDMAEITKLAGAYISSKSERKTEEALILQDNMDLIQSVSNTCSAYRINDEYIRYCEEKFLLKLR